MLFVQLPCRNWQLDSGGSRTQGRGSIVYHRAENSKVNDFHDLLINVHSNDQTQLIHSRSYLH